MKQLTSNKVPATLQRFQWIGFIASRYIPLQGFCMFRKGACETVAHNNITGWHWHELVQVVLSFMTSSKHLKDHCHPPPPVNSARLRHSSNDKILTPVGITILQYFQLEKSRGSKIMKFSSHYAPGHLQSCFRSCWAVQCALKIGKSKRYFFKIPLGSHFPFVAWWLWLIFALFSTFTVYQIKIICLFHFYAWLDILISQQRRPSFGVGLAES